MISLIWFYVLLAWFIIMLVYSIIAYSFYAKRYIKDNKNRMMIKDFRSLKIQVGASIIIISMFLSFLVLALMFLPIVGKIFALIIVNLIMIFIILEVSDEREVVKGLDILFDYD